jgi:hypothetical protein
MLAAIAWHRLCSIGGEANSGRPHQEPYMSDQEQLQTAEPEGKETQDSLPSLSSVFKAEDFFDLSPIEETALSIMCCNSE